MSSPVVLVSALVISMTCMARQVATGDFSTTSTRSGVGGPPARTVVGEHDPYGRHYGRERDDVRQEKPQPGPARERGEERGRGEVMRLPAFLSARNAYTCHPSCGSAHGCRPHAPPFPAEAPMLAYMASSHNQHPYPHMAWLTADAAVPAPLKTIHHKSRVPRRTGKTPHRRKGRTPSGRRGGCS